MTTRQELTTQRNFPQQLYNIRPTVSLKYSLVSRFQERSGKTANYAHPCGKAAELQIMQLYYEKNDEYTLGE